MKIIFHAINGVGLGHVIRTLNLAKAARKLFDCDILFVTNSHCTQFFALEGFNYVRGGVDPLDLVEGRVSEEQYIKNNEAFLLSQIKNFKPDILICDLLIFPNVIKYNISSRIFTVLILRQTLQASYFLSLREVIPFVDLTVIPQKDLSLLNPLFKKIIDSCGFRSDKVIFTNSLFRKPEAEMIEVIKKKYKKQDTDFLITVINGGGGLNQDAQKFFKDIEKIANRVNRDFELKTAFSSKLKSTLRIRWLLVFGPLFRGSISKMRGVEAIAQENNLPALFSISNLVISRAGYNAINEIIAAQVPALINPTERLVDSQEERARECVKSKAMLLFNAENFKYSVALIEKVMDIRKLDEMRRGYNYFNQKSGNIPAVLEIQRKFLEFKKPRKKIGYFRLEIDSIGENFIYEEIKYFNRYRPFYFYKKIRRIDIGLGNILRSHSDSCDPAVSQGIAKAHDSIIREDIKILHAQFITDAIAYWNIIEKTQAPIVITVRGYDLFTNKIDHLRRFFSYQGSLFLARSKFTAEKLKCLGCDPSKIKVMYGGVDTGIINFRPRIIKNNGLRIISAGRFVEKKGFDVTLKAFRKVLDAYPDAKLTLIGEGNLKNEILNQIKDLDIENKVSIKGTMAHDRFIAELYKHDIFLLSSRTARNGDSEGVPNVLKEAMASGMPVISTYHAGIPELVRDQETGFLVPENDYIGMAEKVKFILANNTKVFDMCLNARFFVEKEFDTKKAVLALESLYDHLLIPDYAKTILSLLKGNKPLQFRADLHLIAGCNNRCLMCDNWKNRQRFSISSKKAEKLLDDLKNFGITYVRFHGQEPTLRKDLFSIIRKAKSKGFKVGLKTNAMLLDDRKIKALCGMVDSVYLSIDSPIPGIHNRLRGNRSSFYQNINVCQEIKKINPRIKLYINTVITKINYEYLDRMMDLGRALRVDRISFVNLNTKNKKDIKGLRLTFTQFKDFYFKIYPVILEKSLQFGIPVSADPFFTGLLGLPKEKQIFELLHNSPRFENELRNFTKGDYGKELYKNYKCYGVLDHITIDWDGNVYPCCAMPRGATFSVGNIKKNNLIDIWNSDTYIKYRQKILQGNCKFKDQCSRSFEQTKAINDYAAGVSDSPQEKILSHFLHQFNFSQEKASSRLLRMLYYSFSKSNFYKERFNENAKPERPFNIPKLSFITKSDIKGAFPKEEIIPNYFEEKYSVFRTSSCGPNAFLYAKPTSLSTFHRMAVSFINTGYWKLGRPWLKLTALNCLETVFPILDINQHIIREEDRSVVIIPPSENFLSLPDKETNKLFNLMNDSQAGLIHANPSYLKVLLNRFRKAKLRFHRSFAVHSTYELLLPTTKKLIQKYLNCKIFDQYGCSEIGPISFNCENQQHHIFSDSVYVEIVPAVDLGRKDIGRIVVTYFENHVMPFVKYFTGDFAYITNRESCSCDFNTPIMGKIVGREDEIIQYHGKVIFPLEIDSIFLDIDNILVYQVIFAEDKFLVKIMPEDGLKIIDAARIKNDFKSFWNDKNVIVDVEIAQVIYPGRRGKYRSVIVK